MARPLRFRYAPGKWNEQKVRSKVFDRLDANLGARMRRPWFKWPDGFDARRFEMENGDVALFCWSTGAHDGPRGEEYGAYWLGNTETPETLWRTEKYGFEEVPYVVSRWAERELLAQLHDESPWLKPYPHLSWFFLPVFLSKDGRETTRTFFREHAAGFPDATVDETLAFYEGFLSTGTLDDYREVMAGKLGTSKRVDFQRMSAAMGEFNAAKLLVDAGYDITPEAAVSTGHSIDYRAEKDGRTVLVEVTRPLPPNRRSANTPVAAVRDTAETKTTGQLEEHGGGIVLFVDCSSFPDDDWQAVRGERPDVRHRPAVVFRARPSRNAEGYRKGNLPLKLDGAIDWV